MGAEPVIADLWGFGCHALNVLRDCHIHFKILLEVPHDNLKSFSSNLDELETDLGKKWGGGKVPQFSRGAVTGAM